MHTSAHTSDSRAIGVAARIALTIGVLIVGPTEAATVVTAASSNVVDAAAPFGVSDRIEAVELDDGRRIPIDSLLDWKRVEAMELPLHTARVSGSCARQNCKRELTEGAADITVRGLPGKRASLASIAAESIEQATRAKDWPAAEAAYTRFAPQSAKKSGEDVAWVHWYAARAASAAGNSVGAIARLDTALSAVPDAAPLQRAMVLEERGRHFMLARKFDDAGKDFDAAIELRRKLAPTGIALGGALTRRAEVQLKAAQPQAALKTIDEALVALAPRCKNCRALGIARGLQGVIYTRLDRYADGLPVMRECVAILRALDGATPEVARRLVSISIMVRKAGDFAAAEAIIDESLSIYEQHPGPELDVADAWLERGTVAHIRGDHPEAQRQWRRALEVYRRVEPGTWREAGALNNLGFTARDRGDLAEARIDLEAALAIFQKNDPRSHDTGTALTNLGRLEDRAGNLDVAQARLLAAREVQHAINPAGRSLGSTLLALGSVQTRLGRTDAAAATFAAASTIYETLPKDCYCLAPALRDIGWFELSRRQPAAALKQFDRARQLFASQQPGGLEEADGWQGIGEAQLALGHLREAKTALEHALAARERDAPDDADQAQTLFALGRVSSANREAKQAGELYCAASKVLDRAGRRAGGDNFAQTLFRSQYAEIYESCFNAKLKAGSSAAAFDTLERQRARSFLDSLQQRELDWSRRAPPGLLAALQANQTAQVSAKERAVRNNAPPEERDAARSELSLLRAAAEQLGEQLDAAAPILANLLGLARPKAAATYPSLPDNTALLSYSVRETDSVLLIVDRSGVQARILPIDRATLNDRIQQFRATIARHDPADLPALQKQGAALYDVLIVPAKDALARSDHLLISPDGPLHNLPFAALWERRRAQYFGASHAFSLVDTLATWKELQRTPSTGTSRLVAVADPAPSSVIDSPERGAWPEAARLPALPAARTEVAALAKLYGADSKVLLGDDATEPGVRAAAGSAQVLHFAVHGLLNVNRPLDSALLLGADPTGQDHRGDGLLQVWEIFEDLQLDDNLVVLSSCETAQGKEFRGEGLLGFTRAFEFSGARAVLASLWKVHDVPTAHLMEQFYAARAEHPGDARALQAAVRSMLLAKPADGPSVTRSIGLLSPHETPKVADFSHPYYWAAFQLHGAAN